MAKGPVTVVGADKLIAKLTRVGQLNGAMRGLLGATKETQGIIKRYAPASSANSSARKRWYQRGYGPRWRRRDGSVGGKKTSERLGTRWSHKIDRANLTGTISNNASYAEYVQGVRQARFHRRRGWQTGDMVFKKHGTRLVRIIQVEMDRDLKG